jgi:hypothetical protein
MQRQENVPGGGGRLTEEAFREAMQYGKGPLIGRKPRPMPARRAPRSAPGR